VSWDGESREQEGTRRATAMASPLGEVPQGTSYPPREVEDGSHCEVQATPRSASTAHRRQGEQPQAKLALTTCRGGTETDILRLPCHRRLCSRTERKELEHVLTPCETTPYLLTPRQRFDTIALNISRDSSSRRGLIRYRGNAKFIFRPPIRTVFGNARTKDFFVSRKLRSLTTWLNMIPSFFKRK
jgi:hypothetical protein